MAIATKGLNGKVLQEELLLLIDRHLAGLLANQPQLGELVQFHTEQELKGQIVEVFGRLDRGLPVAVPATFHKKARDVQQTQGWSDLLALLRDWQSRDGNSNGHSLQDRELENLAVGLLWGTVLIDKLAS